MFSCLLSFSPPRARAMPVLLTTSTQSQVLVAPSTHSALRGRADRREGRESVMAASAPREQPSAVTSSSSAKILFPSDGVRGGHCWSPHANSPFPCAFPLPADHFHTCFGCAMPLVRLPFSQTALRVFLSAKAASYTPRPDLFYDQWHRRE